MEERMTQAIIKLENIVKLQQLLSVNIGQKDRLKRYLQHAQESLKYSSNVSGVKNCKSYLRDALVILEEI